MYGCCTTINISMLPGIMCDVVTACVFNMYLITLNVYIITKNCYSDTPALTSVPFQIEFEKEFSFCILHAKFMVTSESYIFVITYCIYYLEHHWWYLASNVWDKTQNIVPKMTENRKHHRSHNVPYRQSLVGVISHFRYLHLLQKVLFSWIYLTFYTYAGDHYLTVFFFLLVKIFLSHLN